MTPNNGVPETSPMPSAVSAASLQPEAEEAAFNVTRDFHAARERVFKAWTEAERLKHWWGPKGFTMGVCNLDLRPGGDFHYSMRTPEGRTMWGKFIYQEITPPERLVFINFFSDEQGNPVRHPLSPTWPLEVLSTLIFTEHQDQTTLTLRGVPISATAAECQTFKDGHESMRQGFKGTLDQLAEYLTKP